jgi:SWIM zinc finger
VGTRSLAHPAPTTTREQHGLELWREHADAIGFDAAERVWLVPSQHDSTSVYEVTIGRKGEGCECADFERRGATCKHIVAATIARAKTGRCDGCGGRFPRRDMHEVGDDHLTFFEGDELCRPCAVRHGVL